MASRTVGRGATVLLVAALLVVGVGSDIEPEPPTAPISTLSPPVEGAFAIQLDGANATTTDGAVTIGFSPLLPDDAEVQVAVDPTFSGIAWSPVAEASSYVLTDTGYQIVYARYRTGPGAEPGPVAVAGINFDSTWDAATSSERGEHRASWARLVRDDVVQVRVETGRVVWNGDPPHDRLVGSELDAPQLDDATRYVIDGNQVGGISVTGVSRVSRPLGRASLDSGVASSLVHDLFVELSEPLVLDTPHVLEFPGSDVEPVTFLIEPLVTESPAVHVNQVGFEPQDEGKFGFVSSWTGSPGGLEYPSAMGFHVVDVQSGSTAMSGTTSRRAVAPDGEWGKGDLTGAPVQEADFSALRTPGRYRLCVDTIGCSPTFDVSDTSTWQRVAVTVAKAMYHQRSGVALGQPYTPLVRPRPFHPDDGVVFEQVTTTMIDDPESIGRDDRFDEYPSSATGEVVTDAWGGHFDAGDWNARISHLGYLASALDLVRLYPEFAQLDLAIPESGDSIPDLLDEGLWDLDLFRRLQAPDGGVPGNVDQGRFGQGRETSWSNSVGVFVYSPDPWSTYIYAAVAAQAAVMLRQYDEAEADRYAESALRAMTWAEATWLARDDAVPALRAAVDPERATAAAAMLQLTNDDRWRIVFDDASGFDEAAMDLLDAAGPISNSAWVYSQVDESLTSRATQANIVESYIRTADTILAGQDTTAFAWTMERPDLPVVWGLGPSIPHGVELLRAFVLTGDVRYRTGAVRSASFSLGGNPLNTSFATGLGVTNPRYPLIVDAVSGGVPVWPGTFVYGVHDLRDRSDEEWVADDILRPAGAYPDPLQVPVLWSWYDMSPIAMMNEFTVAQSHAVALWTFGVLAAT